MKDLNVLKKLYLIFSLFASSLVWADDLPDYLSDYKNLIFDYQGIKNDIETQKLHDSWISPVTVSYSKNWTSQYQKGTVAQSIFSVGIDQPIFKSGGIYYGIKYSQVLKGANSQQIKIQKKALIAQAIDTLFNLKKLKLQKRKLLLLIKNDNIDIKRKKQNYEAGLLDSSFLDQAILKQNRDKLSLLDIKSNIEKLKGAFRMLSSRNPDKLRTPHFKMISLGKYKSKNMDILLKKLKSKESRYKNKMVWSRYLPTVTLHARYNMTDIAAPGQKKNYGTYGFTVSMPLNVNMSKDLESSRVSYLQSMVELQDSRRSAEIEYKMVRENLYILNKKIALTRKNETLYRKLYNKTKDSVKVGQKTAQDEQIMLNSLKIQRVDRAIYYIEKQQQLLKLYTKVSS